MWKEGMVPKGIRKALGEGNVPDLDQGDGLEMYTYNKNVSNCPP